MPHTTINSQTLERDSRGTIQAHTNTWRRCSNPMKLETTSAYIWVRARLLVYLGSRLPSYYWPPHQGNAVASMLGRLINRSTIRLQSGSALRIVYHILCVNFLFQLIREVLLTKKYIYSCTKNLHWDSCDVYKLLKSLTFLSSRNIVIISWVTRRCRR